MAETASKIFTILFAGGGSGGHLMPGLSVAQDLRRRFGDSCRLLFVGSTKALESRLVASGGFEFLSLPSVKKPELARDVPAWLGRCAGGLFGGRRLIGRIAPDLVVSLGGYAALAPATAAVIQDVPLVVMEQNAIPGKVNYFLSKWAEEVYVPWPRMEALFWRPERVIVTGNPIRDELLHRPRKGEAESFGLSSRKRTLLVMGGSQGSRFLNRVVVDALPRLDSEANRLQILHSTGEGDHEEVRAAYGRHRLQASVHRFIEDMASAYAVCDLALCRAGGTTLAELTALGVPAVLAPLPTAANDHQRRNASYAAGAGAAFIVEENEVGPGQLAAIVLRLLANESCLARARAASLRLGRPAATQTVADRLLERLSVPVPAPKKSEATAVMSGV